MTEAIAAAVDITEDQAVEFIVVVAMAAAIVSAVAVKVAAIVDSSYLLRVT